MKRLVLSLAVLLVLAVCSDAPGCQPIRRALWASASVAGRVVKVVRVAKVPLRAVKALRGPCR